MKKIYIAPTALRMELQTGGILALSANSKTQITGSNKDEFDGVYSNKKEHPIWGGSSGGDSW